VTAVRTLRCGRISRAVLLVVIAALIPLPALAGEKDAPAKLSDVQPLTSGVLARELALPPIEPPREPQSWSGASDVSRPLSTAISRAVGRVSRASQVRRSEQAAAGTDSPTFFKTPTGAVVLAVMIVGAGYAIYSAQHDRIHSPGKK
jgi:hypothetical protein